MEITEYMCASSVFQIRDWTTSFDKDYFFGGERRIMPFSAGYKTTSGRFE
jgi:hypothetical protein